MELYNTNYYSFMLTQVLSREIWEHFFYRTPPLAASLKGCNFTKIRLRHGCFVNFLKISERFFDAQQEFSKTSQKHWRKNVC